MGDSIETAGNAHVEDETKRALPWKKQVTVRGLVASVLIGSMFSVIAMKLVLTTGISPHFNVSAALVAFIFIKVWTKGLHKMGMVSAPFTRQENTMIQTCSVACYSIALGGGFGSYLLAMNKRTFEQAGGISNSNSNTIGGNSISIKEPTIGWMIPFLFLVSFIGLFVLVPLRKILIIDYKLTFPSGMATAVLINGFHNRGDKLAKKQINGFIKTFCASFMWGFFQWFYTSKDKCGFSQFPTFGLQARKQTFYFDFSLTYVGTGMICPHSVNLSLLLGSVVSYGMMWPLIATHKGHWFPSNVPETSMKSLNGYKVFIPIALLLGDGLYNFTKILRVTLINMHSRFNRKKQSSASVVDGEKLTREDESFASENIPLWLAMVGYITLAIISVLAIPLIFPDLKWYLVILAYIITPSLAFCNAYGAGLTDFNMSYNYGKVALFIVAAISGNHHGGGGIIASLAACGLFKSVINVSCILMQDLKTGHLTMSSPRAMLLSQAVGTALGCVISPLTFLLFYKAFDIGNPDAEFKAPFAIIYRNLAVIGVEGFSALPQHCVQLCCGFFVGAVGINLVRDLGPGRIGKWMPIPTAMAVPFLVGAYFAIDMCVGTAVVFVWQKMKKEKAALMVPVVASGLICGEGLWILPASVLALAKVTPPICMKFLAS